MIELQLSVPGAKNGSIKLQNFTSALPSQMVKGLARMGAVLQKHIVTNLSGQSHSQYPGNGNEYPGVVSGQLKKIEMLVTKGGSGPMLRVGPNAFTSKYAAIQEFGGTVNQTVTKKQAGFLYHKLGHWIPVGSRLKIVIPPRPYMSRGWADKGQESIDKLQATLAEPLDK